MKAAHTIALCLILIVATAAGIAQPGRPGSTAAASSRYFQITLNLKFAQAADQQPASETITTQVAVRDGKPGSCKARMLSQVPTGTGGAMKYIELGTKLDCNDVRVEGDGIALEFALETSGYMGTAKTKGSEAMVTSAGRAAASTGGGCHDRNRRICDRRATERAAADRYLEPSLFTLLEKGAIYP